MPADAGELENAKRMDALLSNMIAAVHTAEAMATRYQEAARDPEQRPHAALGTIKMAMLNCKRVRGYISKHGRERELLETALNTLAALRQSILDRS